jgi:hypothetical protein
MGFLHIDHICDIGVFACGKISLANLLKLCCNKSESGCAELMNVGKVAILYERLSRDDGDDAVGDGIVDQRQLLEEFARRDVQRRQARTAFA